MQEISIKNNSLGLKVLIDDFPDISLMPASDLNLLISDLELEISTYVEQKRNRKSKKLEGKPKEIPP